ncbi:hypothetical protein Tco_0600841, partial [Tanacetum coccineum]
HGYAVSSLMDTAYLSSEQTTFSFSFHSLLGSFGIPLSSFSFFVILPVPTPSYDFNSVFPTRFINTLFVNVFAFVYGICTMQSLRKGDMVGELNLIRLGFGYCHDILRDILGCNSLPKEFGIDFSSESFEFLHQNGVIESGVASTGENNGFWFAVVLGIIQEIEFQKDFVIEDFESFVGSIIEEDSSGVENTLS